MVAEGWVEDELSAQILVRARYCVPHVGGCDVYIPLSTGAVEFGRSQSPSPPCCNVTTRVTNRADTTLTSVSEQCGTRPKKGRSVQMAASGGETGANSDVETDHGESVDILRSGVERAIRVSGSFLQHLMRLGSPSLPPHLPLRPLRVSQGDREQQPHVWKRCAQFCVMIF